MKELVIKDWLWKRIATESNAPRVWGGHVDCVFQETERAYKAMMGAVNHTVFTWIPKSQCEWVDTEDACHETFVVDGYERALEVRDDVRSCFL